MATIVDDEILQRVLQNKKNIIPMEEISNILKLNQAICQCQY